MLYSDTAERLFDALNLFPHLTADDRARIYTAAQIRSGQTWAVAKEIRLDTGALRPVTLAQAVKWEALPTASQIIAGLMFMAGALA